MVLVAEGATDQSYAQLKKVLHLPNDLVSLRTPYRSYQRLLLAETPSIDLAMNLALFSDANRLLEHNYVHILKNDYEADHLSLNFRSLNDASKIINEHISNRTRGKIQNAIKTEDLVEPQFLLMSSMFFKGQWKVRSDSIHSTK